MSDKIQIGRIRVSPQMMALMFDLPPDHSVVDVYVERAVSPDKSDRIVLTVEGPRMPELREGHLAEEVELTYRQSGGEPRKLAEVGRL